MKNKILLIITLVLLFPAYSLASDKVFEYGFEDWGGTIATTPLYPFGSTDGSYCTIHQNTTEVVTSYAGISAHTGSYFFLMNHAAGTPDVSMPAGITDYSVNNRNLIGLGLDDMSTNDACGSNPFDLEDVTTGEFFIRFWAITSDWGHVLTNWNAKLKFVRFYEAALVDMMWMVYQKASDVPLRRPQFGMDGAGAPYYTAIIPEFANGTGYNNDGAWHKFSMYVNYNTGVTSFWFDVTDETSGNTLITHNYGAGGIPGGPRPDVLVFIGNWSANNPTENVYHCIDDIEIWNGMPDAGGNAPPVVTIGSPASCPHNTDTTPITITGTSSDSDGTVSTIKWNNSAPPADNDNACTDTGTDWDTWSCEVILQSGENNISIVADDGTDTTNDTCIITYSVGTDYTDPVIAITSPTAATYYNSTSSATINLSGTATDDVAMDSVTWTCPTCTVTSGTASSGSGTWTITGLAPAMSGYGSEIVIDGAFVALDDWSQDPPTGSDWSLSSSTALCSGADDNESIQQEPFSIPYAWYLFGYEVVTYTSGDLYFSQWGMPGEGNTITLSNVIGAHTEDVDNIGDDLIRITSYQWVGSIDNVTLRQKGVRNVVTVTAVDTSNNTADAVLYVNAFKKPSSISGCAITGGSVQ